jgi:hypothetical protein
MLPKNKLLLLSLICVLASCKEETPDYSIKRPAALSLPEVKKDDSIIAFDASALKTISVTEAVTRSSAVFSGVVLSIDSSNYQHQHSLPVYLFNIKVKQSWKGNFIKESRVNFISRAIITTHKERESLFFLTPVDTANIFASGKKIYWQWTFNAPQNGSVNDSIEEVIKQALSQQL